MVRQGGIEQLKPAGQPATNSCHWWSVDPGQVHVGIADWRGSELHDAFEAAPEGFLDALYRTAPELLVVEAFSLSGPRYDRSKAKQAVDTIRLIGAIHGLEVALGYENRGFAIVEQQPSVRHVAQRSPFWAKTINHFPLSGNSHVRSAVAHGVYFLHFTERGRRLFPQ